MKKEGKIKINGRDFILVPKRDFLNLLQSLCISVLNTGKMLILQVATTLLVEQRSLQGFTILTQGTQILQSIGWAGKPRTVCSGLMNKNAGLGFVSHLSGHSNAWEVCEAQLWVQEPAACLEGAGGRANQHFLLQGGRRAWHTGQAPLCGIDWRMHVHNKP